MVESQNISSDPKKISKVDILGVPFYSMSWDESLTIFEALLLAGHQYQIAKANPEFVMTALKDPEVMEILRKTVFNTADGAGILWAARFLSLPPKGFFGTLGQLFLTGLETLLNTQSLKKIIPERVGGVEHVIDECSIAAKHGVSVFLMGSTDKARLKTAEFLKKKIPGLIISGHAGSFKPFEDEKILIDEVNKSGAGLLIVCFGHPLQEKWIYKNMKKMPAVRIADGEGGTFDYMAGIFKRAPHWMRRFNLEWLWRILTQRGRGEKMKRSLPQFISNVFRAKLLKSRLEKKLKVPL